MADQSDGNVTGLREVVNDWLLRHFFDAEPPNLDASPTYVMTYVGLGNGIPDDNGGSLLYELIDRKGGMAIWAIREMYVYVRWPEARMEGDNPVWSWNSENWLLIPFFTESHWLAYPEHILQLLAPGEDLCFMTVSYPPPVGEVRSTVWEHVVSMGVTDSYNPTAAWAFLLDDWQPDEICWRSDGIAVIADNAAMKGDKLV
jgi:hypothetical protein